MCAEQNGDSLSLKGNTGAVDVHVERVTLLNPADTDLPFLPSNPHNLVSLFYVHRISPQYLYTAK